MWTVNGALRGKKEQDTSTLCGDRVEEMKKNVTVTKTGVLATIKA